MTSGFDPRIDPRRAALCGAALLVAVSLAPLSAWLAPLAFAPVMALAGLLALGSLRLESRLLPGLAPLLGALVWAVASISWSTFRPEDVEGWTALKLVLQLVVYWSCICAARAAPPPQRERALLVMAVGLGCLGVLFLVEGLSDAFIYKTLRTLLNDPIRPDLAVKNVAQGGFALAVLVPLATLAIWRCRPIRWLVAAPLAGLVVSSIAFGSDAPLLAAGVAVLAALAGLVAPVWAPRAAALGVVAYFMLTPGLIRLSVDAGLWSWAYERAPLSWSQRMDYWYFALQRIQERPVLGWGLDAARTFTPHIRLHPHDAAIQLWLELGLIGVSFVAAFWAALLLRLSSPERSLSRASSLASAGVYLVFAAVSFGVWQEWWLAVGAMAAMAATLLEKAEAYQKSSSTAQGLSV